MTDDDTNAERCEPPEILIDLPPSEGAVFTFGDFAATLPPPANEEPPA